MGALILSIIALIISVWILIKMFAIILRFAIYCVICFPVWIILSYIPGYTDEIGFIVILFIVAVVKSLSKRTPKGNTKSNTQSNISYPSYSYSFDSFKDYVLNKKTGVIHDKWSSSADTISEKHRKELSYSDAQDLVNKSRRYRFKE